MLDTTIMVKWFIKGFPQWYLDIHFIK